MKVKKVLTLALSLLLVMGAFLTPAYASSIENIENYIKPLETPDDTIIPFWNNIATIHPGLTAIGNTLWADVTISAQSSTSSITGTMYLEEEVGVDDWDSVKSWSIQGTGHASKEGSYSGDSGSTYRVRVKVFVGGESATVYSNEITL